MIVDLSTERISAAMKIASVLESRLLWTNKEIFLTCWLLHSQQLNLLADDISNLFVAIPTLGVKLRNKLVIDVVFKEVDLKLVSSAFMYIGDMWTSDLCHKYSGEGRVAKVKLKGKVIYQPFKPSTLLIGHHKEFYISVMELEPIFEGVIESSNYIHYKKLV